MHIHLPKPLHGWREFVGEVGIIVLGILFALGFEQLVELGHWRHKVEQATEALHADVTGLAMQAAEQQVAGPCIDRQLEMLEQRLASPGPYRPAPMFRDSATGQFAVRAPSRSWGDGTWRTVVSEGVSTHLGSDLRDRLSGLYASVHELGDVAQQADTAGWRLRVLAQPIAMDAATRARLSEEVEELRGRQELMTLMVGQQLGWIGAAGMMPPPARVRAYLDESGTVAFCRARGLPLGAVRPIRT